LPDYEFSLNGQQFSRITGPSGSFIAFSGDGPHRNNVSSTAVANGGPIPQGCYYIVERPSGGLLGPVRDLVLHRDEWFALYRSDGTVDDQTFVDGLRRGAFRLHPLGPLGISTGCVVVQHTDDFARLRAALISTAPTPIPGVALPARRYGTLMVT
jgi:hypothetical protein